MKTSGIITLTTDFGMRDAYVAAMKGVILGIAADVKMVDVTHEVGHGDVEEAAFILKSAADYFPRGTVHLAVVDPGVGTDRRPMALISNGQVLVGPDNGIFTYFMRGDFRAYHLNKRKYFLKKISDTFHGRDVFAPAAAHILKGADPRNMGSLIRDPVRFARKPPVRKAGGITGRVIHVDRFGNLVTDIPAKMLPRDPVIKAAGKEIKGISGSYAEKKKGGFLAVIGSAGLLEISCSLESAAKKLGAGRGTKVSVAGKK